jgi:hypothetical protein
MLLPYERCHQLDLGGWSDCSNRECRWKLRFWRFVTNSTCFIRLGRWAFVIGQPCRGRRGRTDIVKGRSVRFGGNVLTTLSCSASSISASCCDLTPPPITRLARTFQSKRTRRRREQYIPLVAFCLRHFLAAFIICTCECDFRQAPGVPML